ncbi:MAG: PAS domain S-box protein [Acidobacteriota bacterium]|nr:PAS domain S-box protein [Acidobacteriota bacterium]
MAEDRSQTSDARRSVLDQPEAHLRSILDASLDGLITIDGAGRIVEFNLGAERIFGYEREAVLGREMAEMIVPPAFRDRHRMGLARYLETGDGPILGRRLEIVGMRSDGSEFPVELTVMRVPAEGPVLFTGALRDITERKRVEARRLAQYRITRILSEAASLNECASDLLEEIGRGLDWEFAQLWTVSSDGESLRRMAGWSQRPGWAAGFEALSRATEFRKGIGLPGRVWARGAAGWLEDVLNDPNFPRIAQARSAGIRSGFATPISSRGTVLGVIEAFSSSARAHDDDMVDLGDAIGRQIGDFLERKRAEAAIRESEARYRRILETTNEGIWWIDADARTIYVNDRLCGMLGRTEGEILGHPIFEFLHPDEHARIREMLGRRRHGIAEQFDAGFVRGDGAPLIAIVSSSPVLDASGQYTGALAMLTDITERKRSEESDRFLLDAARILGSSLDESLTVQNLAELAVPRIGDWCAVEIVGEGGDLQVIGVAHRDPEKIDLARRIRMEYPAAPNSPDGAPGVVATGQSQMLARVPDDFLVARARSPEHLEMMRSLGLASFLCVPLPARGRVLGALTLATAESRRPFDDFDLRLAERTASLAAIAIDNARLYREAREAVQLRNDFLSVAGHELRTPLSVLSLQVHTMLSGATGAGGSGVAAVRADRVKRSLDRLSRLVDDLLDVSRVNAGRLRLEPEDVDFAALCREVVDRLDAEAEARGSRIELDAPGAVAGRWDPRRLDQVIQNLVSNAIKYGEGRPIRVTVSGDGETARLVVRDEGIGIASADQDRIFRRFERAVAERNFGGLGLGLWITKEIVDACGGEISVESAPGAGSTFRVTLPRSGTGSEKP